MKAENESSVVSTGIQGSGCVIRGEDRPLVLMSLLYFGAFLVYGASATVLGAALPSLSSEFDRSKSEFGLGFTSRGIGYFCGTLLSAYVLQLKAFEKSKSWITAISLMVTGVAGGVVTLSTNFPVAITMFFVQGIGFGGIDTVGNCGLPEMWGRRVQPWMQAMHSCFGLGGIVGPSLVGSLGYIAAFRIIAFMSFVPFLCLLSPIILQRCVNDRHIRTQGWNTLPEDADVERTIELSVVDHAQGSIDPQQVSALNATGSQNGSGSSNDTADDESASTVIAPSYITFIVAFFYFIYVGAETGYAGWVPTYAILIDVTQNKSKAAYLSAIFWAALTAGRFLAIPSAVFISATAMIRIQLLLIIIGGVCTVLFFGSSYSAACWVTGFVGFALSSIFPVMMTLFGDYGFAMDPHTTSMFMVGATFGESIVPVLIGVALSFAGASAFPAANVLASCILVALYFAAHHTSQNYMQHLQFVDGAAGEGRGGAGGGAGEGRGGAGGRSAFKKGGHFQGLRSDDDYDLDPESGSSSHPLHTAGMHTILGEDDEDEDVDEDEEGKDAEGDHTHAEISHTKGPHHRSAMVEEGTSNPLHDILLEDDDDEEVLIEAEGGGRGSDVGGEGQSLDRSALEAEMRAYLDIDVIDSPINNADDNSTFTSYLNTHANSSGSLVRIASPLPPPPPPPPPPPSSHLETTLPYATGGNSYFSTNSIGVVKGSDDAVDRSNDHNATSTVGSSDFLFTTDPNAFPTSEDIAEEDEDEDDDEDTMHRSKLAFLRSPSQFGLQTTSVLSTPPRHNPYLHDPSNHLPTPHAYPPQTPSGHLLEHPSAVSAEGYSSSSFTPTYTDSVVATANTYASYHHPPSQLQFFHSPQVDDEDHHHLHAPATPPAQLSRQLPLQPFVPQSSEPSVLPQNPLSSEGRFPATPSQQTSSQRELFPSSMDTLDDHEDLRL